MNKKTKIKLTIAAIILAPVAYYFLSCNIGNYLIEVIPLYLNNLTQSKDKIIVDGILQPELPDFYANNSDIKGVDSNNNGIRDDIEIWINKHGKNKEIRMAMRQLALAYEHQLEILYEEKIFLDKYGPISLDDHEHMSKYTEFGDRLANAMTEQGNAYFGCMTGLTIKKILSPDEELILDTKIYQITLNNYLRWKYYKELRNHNYSVGVDYTQKEFIDYCKTTKIWGN